VVRVSLRKIATLVGDLTAMSRHATAFNTDAVVVRGIAFGFSFAYTGRMNARDDLANARKAYADKVRENLQLLLRQGRHLTGPAMLP